MKAIIMAGGSGQRLRPLTCTIPKPMVPVMNRPVMAYALELLKAHDIDKVGVTLQYLPSSISNYFGNHFEGVDIEYFVENEPLGTAGSVFSSGDYANEPLLIISGDALCDIDLTSAINFHRDNKSVATLVLKSVEVPLEYGVVLTEADGRIQRFIEKPEWSEIYGNLVNTGIYILEPEAWEGFEKNTKFDFAKDVFPKIMQRNLSMFGYITEDYWCDIGSIEQYISAHADILQEKVRVKLNAKNYDGVWFENNAMIDHSCVIKGPCYIGKDAKILSGVAIEPFSVIGSNCLVDTGASIKRSIIWENSEIGKRSELRSAIICDNVIIGEGSAVYEQSIISSQVRVGTKCIISDRAKIWPNKQISRDSLITSDVIWGDNKELFSLGGIMGDAATFTPEVVCRLGKAIAQGMPISARVGVACDGSTVANMIKYALSAGIMAGAADVFDCDCALQPVLNSAVKLLGLETGVYIHCDDSLIRIDLVDEKAQPYTSSMRRDLSTKFENANASPAKDVGFLVLKSDMSQFYIADLLRRIDLEFMQQNPRTIVFVDAGTRENNMVKLIFSYCRWNVSFVDSIQEARKLYRKINAPAFALERGNFKIIPAGNAIEHHELDLFFSFLDLENGAKQIYIDAFAPPTVEKIAQNYGAQANRLHSRDILNAADPDSFLYAAKSDVFFAMLKVCEWLTKNGCTIDQIAAKLPFVQVQQRNVKMAIKDIGRVFRTLNEEERSPHKESQTEGLRIATKNGWVHIVPYQNEIRIAASAFGQEYAESIADLYAKRVDRLAKQKKDQ